MNPQIKIDNDTVLIVLFHKWYINKGYVVSTAYTYDKKPITLFMHRLIWEKSYGTIPNDKEIDHINGNKLDNRLTNLRLVTHRENMSNHTKHRSNSYTSKYVGVYFDKQNNRWLASIYINGKRSHLGRFTSEYNAHLAYQAKLSELSENPKAR